jgi:hypothetical protein
MSFSTKILVAKLFFVCILNFSVFFKVGNITVFEGHINNNFHNLLFDKFRHESRRRRRIVIVFVCLVLVINLLMFDFSFMWTEAKTLLDTSEYEICIAILL